MADSDATYCLLADVKSELGIPPATSTYDADLSRMITQASRAVDAFTGRRFYTPTLDETRLFDVPREWTDDLLLDFDLYSLTSITNGNGTVIASTDFVLLPANSTPKWGVRLKWRSRSTVWEPSADGDYEQVVQVTGKWGFSSSAPGPIARAVADTVKAWHNCKQSGGIKSQTIDNYSVSYVDMQKGELPEGVKADLLSGGFVRMRLA